MSTLKPCPFCGKDPNQTTAELGNIPCFYYECGNPKCGATEMGWHDTEQEARDAWNTRPIEDALQARIAELEAEVTNLNEWLTAWKESFNLAQAEIAKLKAIAIQWHKYPDEKPPESGFYIVCCGKDVFIDWFNDGTDDCVGDEYIDHTRGLYCDPIWGITSSDDSIIPTHWAYLPAPPKEEE